MYGGLNHVFAQRGYALEAPFLDALAMSCGAGVVLPDFRGAPDPSRLVINDYIAGLTERAGGR